ncbi:MAG: methionine synthase [Pseudomonadota bacterium]
MDFRTRAGQGLLFFDGGMGTQIQELALPAEVWQGQEGCNELLNLTAPDAIQAIHARYVAAGAEVVETNTFGANAVVLAEYGLEDRVEELNHAAAQVARRAVDGSRDGTPRFVAGSLGPGTRLVSLGQTDFATLLRSYTRQAEGLIAGGADLLLVETCQDPLQIKAALCACRDALKAAGRDLPLAVSVTVETTGTLLVGSEVDAVLALLEPFDLDLLGMNCATGPDAMRPYVQRICQQFGGSVLVQPNAGIPRNEGGQAMYPLGPEAFARALVPLVVEEGASAVGGCCGTTPAHIEALRTALDGKMPAPRAPAHAPSVTSLFSARTLHQDPRPFLVGERTNANGSRQFKKHLVNEDWDGVVAVGRSQARGGAHALDVCVALAGRDEARDMREVVSRLVRQVDLPLCIDSTDLNVLQTALELCGGRALINSVNLEAGEERARAICQLARRHGAALIALTIDEHGMAMTVERKRTVARRIHALAVDEIGLKPEDLLFDPLTFTLGSGDPALRDAGLNTLEGIRQIKADLPGVRTVLGVSNISFGLKDASREVINAVFLDLAVQAGLDAAIVNAARLLPLYRIADDDRERALDLILQRGEGDPLLRLIEHFDHKSGHVIEREAEENLTLDQRLQRAVIDGVKTGLEALLERKRAEIPALDIVNTLLIPAMKKVGELFGSGQMQLPFVLQAAEVMKHAVSVLEPFMERSDRQARKCLVLATVRGDVHDIGKNLVDIILTNNGYAVHNLGINCEVTTLLDKAQEVAADAIGLSGLLVKSTVVMRENLQEMQRRGVHIPVLLGGAALTPEYVVDHCASALDAPVLYCTDAFAGLRAMEQVADGSLAEAARAQAARVRARPAPRPSAARVENIEPLHRETEVPAPPFWGSRVVSDIALDEIYPFLTEVVLFRGRWGYRRGALDKQAYEDLIENTVRPEFERLKARCRDEHILQPKVVYGYYPACSDGDQVVIYQPKGDQELTRLRFPRQRKSPGRCIADYFWPVGGDRRDLIALQVVTVGPQAEHIEQELYQQDRYKDYLLLHGLSVETAEALAEFWHKKVRAELGLLGDDGQTMDELVAQKYRGSRYSFGYPACPDLDQNKLLFDILDPARIGVTLTENAQMVPEQTTSAFIVHHPQAKYFTLE